MLKLGLKVGRRHGRASASASGAQTSTRPSAITYLVAMPRPIQTLSGLRLLHRHHGSTADVLRFVLYGIRQAALPLFNVTEHPQAQWVVQRVRNLSVQYDHLPRSILHDRDGKFSEQFEACAKGSGAKIMKLPARSPNLNAYAERWVRSIRE